MTHSLQYRRQYKHASDPGMVISWSVGINTVSTLLIELPECKDKEEWAWNFDHTGADIYNSQFKVVAISN